MLTRAGALPPERILGVETGGCPHTAIREDASINLAGVADMTRRFPGLDLLLIESGGDNLAATFSPELADLTIYVIDVAGGDKIPRKGGPGITRSDLLVINKIDLAPFVGASLDVMDRDAADARRAPVRVRQYPRGHGGGRDHRLHRDRRGIEVRPAGVATRANTRRRRLSHRASPGWHNERGRRKLSPGRCVAMPIEKLTSGRLGGLARRSFPGASGQRFSARSAAVI